MKVILQVSTSTLGDMIVEEGDEKTTTNPIDQKAIIVELLVQALGKVTAAYKIPKDMLDLGDEEYESAHSRKVASDQEPRYSSAAVNRAAQQPKECCMREEEYTEDIENDDDDVNDDTLDMTEEEFEFVKGILHIMRGKENKNV